MIFHWPSITNNDNNNSNNNNNNNNNHNNNNNIPVQDNPISVINTGIKGGPVIRVHK